MCPPSVPSHSSLAFAHKKEQHGENQVDKNDEKYGHYHGARRRTPDFFRAGACRQPLMTSYRGNRDPEHDALDQPGHNVSQIQGVERSPDVPAKEKIRLRYAKERSAQDS